MNRLTLFVICCLATKNLVSQQLIMVDAAYKTLKGAVRVTDTKAWDDLLGEVDEHRRMLLPGFSVTVNHGRYDSFYISQGKLIAFSGNKVENLGFAVDFCDLGIGDGLSRSAIEWKMTGRKGRRILKVEWKNIGFFDEWSYNGVCSHYMNFQIWLREKGGSAELRWGERHLTPGQAHEIAQAIGKNECVTLKMGRQSY
jgi:hypothetical protein